MSKPLSYRLKHPYCSIKIYKKKKLKKSYLNRAEFEKIKKLLIKPKYCQECGKKNDKLDWHHINKNAKNNNISNLIAICKPCHRQKHLELPEFLFN